LALSYGGSFIHISSSKKKVKGILLKGNNLEAFKLASLKQTDQLQNNPSLCKSLFHIFLHSLVLSAKVPVKWEAVISLILFPVSGISWRTGRRNCACPCSCSVPSGKCCDRREYFKLGQHRLLPHYFQLLFSLLLSLPFYAM